VDILVVGTGSVGAALARLLLGLREQLRVGEVFVYKHTPREQDRPLLLDLRARGARLVVRREQAGAFNALGVPPDVLGLEEAVRSATAVFDCSADGAGLENKRAVYERYADGRLFVAQGSEAGFGVPFVVGTNDQVLHGGSPFVHVASCNTHATCAILSTIGLGGRDVAWGRFVYVRRASDVGQEGGFVPAIVVDAPEGEYGAHQAEDAAAVFRTVGVELDLWGTSLKVNSQYTHAIYFHLGLRRTTSPEEVEWRIACNPWVARTHKRMSSLVFSYGRDVGPSGRLMSHAVFVMPTVCVRREREVVGFCFTPQDGNVLSSTVAALRALEPDLDATSLLRPYLLPEV
jgi:glyceraldehyde-3-phosphate dehydrogenase (NAD(P))